MGKGLAIANPALHRFNVREYYGMMEIGVLQEDASVELLKGKVFDRSDGTLHKFSVKDYYRMAETGVIPPGGASGTGRWKDYRYVTDWSVAWRRR
jgi:hypothetical protein